MRLNKICHLTSVHPVKDGRIFYKECVSLAKAGYEVTLIAAGADNETCEGISILGVPKLSGRLGRILGTTKNIYKKAIEVDADIYHFHDPELLPYGLKLKKKGKTVIFDSHEFVGEQIKTKRYIPSILRNIISKVYKWYEEYVCHRIDAVIQVCTINGKNYFANRCKQSCYITNAPIISEIQLLESVDTHDLKKIVHVGSLTYDRGITELAYAINKVDGFLVLAGPFESQEFEIAIQKICGDKLIYKGILYLDQIPSLLKECGIGTSTLLDKGQYKHIDVLPTKIYDYMLAGIPVIMSNFPYLVEFNRKYKIGICVSPDDPKEISDAINHLLSHPDEALQMGKNGRKAVIEEFNWGIEERKLLALYASFSI